MKRKRILGGLLAAILSIVVSLSASAGVGPGINGCWYKNAGSHGGERITIRYNPSTGNASAVYEETYSYGSEQYFSLSGYASGGYLVLSGRGVCRGRRTSMRIRVTMDGPNTLKSVTANGRAYYFFR